MEINRHLKRNLLLILCLSLFFPAACSTVKSAGNILKEEAQSLMFWKKQKPYLDTDFLVDQDVREIGGHEYVRIKNPDYGQRLDAPQFIWVEKEKYLKTYYGIKATSKGEQKIPESEKVGTLPPPPPQYIVKNYPKPGQTVSTPTAGDQGTKPPVPERTLKRKILLLAFVNNTGEAVDFVVDAVYIAIKKRLLKSDQVILIERDAMDNYLKRLGLSLSSINDKTVLIHAGEALGIQGFFFGSIDRLLISHSTSEKTGKEQSWATIELHINLIDARTATLVVSSKGTNNLYKAEAEGEGSRIQAVKSAVEQALKQALPPVLREVKSLPWETRIIKIEGEKIFIDAGRDTGLMVGDILSVYQRGVDITIPSTKIIVGRQKGPLLGKIQIVDFFGIDSSIAVAKKGGNFHKGDIVIWGN